MTLDTISQLWHNAWPAAVTMVALGGVFALILLIASEKLKVEVDEKIEQIKDALPGVDCGACGFAGCGSYAKALASDPELLGKCSPGGAATSEKIAEILNLQVSGEGAAQRPVVFCRAKTADKTVLAAYHGIETCLSANALANSQACNFGCLSYGDCTRVCKFDAIEVIDGLATVDYEKCTGCGACLKACPRNLIKMVPFKYPQMMTVACSSIESGRVTRSVCKVGCIGCGLCVKKTDIFSLNNNNASIDYSRYEQSEQAEAAMAKCPTGVIVLCGKDAPKPRAAGVKKSAAQTT